MLLLVSAALHSQKVIYSPITAVDLYNPIWMASCQFLLPFLEYLPKSWTTTWIE